MDRKSKIFAPVKTVAGRRKAVKEVNPQKKALWEAMNNFKKQAQPTMLKSFSYKSGDKIFSCESVQIRAFLDRKKTVCLVVTGDMTEVSEKKALDAVAKEFDSSIGGANQEELFEGVKLLDDNKNTENDVKEIEDAHENK